MVVRVILKRNGVERIIDVCDTEEKFQSITVEQLKEKIQDRDGYWYPDRQRLILGGKQLEDRRLLTEYGIRHMSHISLVERLRGGGGGGPGWGDGGMGDKEGKNQSMERLFSL